MSTRLPLSLALTLLASPLAAARVEIVLDVSGSMRASAGPMSRMEAAQRAVKATVEGIDSSSNVALRLYGHRLPSEPKVPSCEDTELVIPFGPLDRQRFVAAVEAARPLGQTPLAYSLERAAADFGELDDETAAVILVSDGEESCGGDPARVACAFRERGLELTVHTVGFDVGAKAREQLQAVARCTGGEYRDARNAGELANSLRQLTQAGLLLDKDREELGREVRGGNGFDSAVLLPPGTYHLDHHQRPNEFDYFAVDVPAGHVLRASQESYEIGLTISGSTFREGIDGDFSPAGVAVFRPDRGRVDYRGAIQRGEQASVSTIVPAGAAGRYYVAIGHESGYPWGIHKSSPFTLELVDQTDAGSGTDAGDGEREAVSIRPGEHRAWLQTLFGQEKDVFTFDVTPGATYEVRIRPERQDPMLGIRLTDEDGNVLGEAQASAEGAAARIEAVQAARAGRFLLVVDDRRTQFELMTKAALEPAFRDPTAYSLTLTETVAAVAGPAAATALPVTAGSSEGAEAPRPPARFPTGALACATAVGLGTLLLAGAIVGFVILRKRRAIA